LYDLNFYLVKSTVLQFVFKTLVTLLSCLVYRQLVINAYPKGGCAGHERESNSADYEVKEKDIVNVLQDAAAQTEARVEVISKNRTRKHNSRL
jgi:hypothetical protein